MNQSSGQNTNNTNTPNPLASSPWSSITGGGFAAPGGNYGSPFGVTAQLGAGPWTGSQQQPPTTGESPTTLPFLTGIQPTAGPWTVDQQQPPTISPTTSPPTGITGIAAPGGNYNNPAQLGGGSTIGGQQQNPTTSPSNSLSLGNFGESGLVSSSGGYDPGYQQFLQNNPDWVKNNSPAEVQLPQQAYEAYQRQQNPVPVPVPGIDHGLRIAQQQPPQAPVPPPMTYNPGYGQPGVAQQHIPGRHLMPQRSPFQVTKV